MINLNSKNFYHLQVALQFLTRLPVPKDLNPEISDLSKSGIYFPAVGIILGVLTWLLFKASMAFGISTNISVLLAMSLAMMLTGGFHEDGLADSFDGIGGAFEKSRKLEIMKDSRLGTYGALALIAALGIRFTSLTEVATNHFFSAIVVSLMLGRLSSLIIIPFTPYSSHDDKSKSKPVIEGIGSADFKVPLMYSFAVSTLLIGLMNTLGLFIILGAVVFAARAYSVKQIDGITGDVLGAINIVCELVALIYITLI